MNSSQSYGNILLYEAQYNVIANNKLSHSAYSNIQVFGDNLNSNGTQILNNNISNSSTNGNAIDIEGNADSTLIQGDSVSMTNSASEDALIFYGYSSSSTLYYPAANIIRNNVISAYSYGISLYGNVYPISTFTINNNKITMISQSTSDGAPIWLGSVGSSSVDVTYIYDNRLIGGNNGIYFSSSADYLNIYNNYISNNNYGVYVSSSSSDINQLYFNSFYNSNTNLYFVSGSNAYWKVKDNILYTTGTSNTNANIFVANNTTFADCNYNLFYAPSGASTANFNSAKYASLSAWQAVTHATATSHGDESSVTGSPLYSNPTSNNLDVTGLTPTDEKGVAISGITTDIYNHTRFTPPSIGAEEPIPSASAGTNTVICQGGSVQLTGGVGLSYFWSPATGLSSTTVSNPIASPTVSTQYTLTVSDGNEISTSIVTVSVNPLPMINMVSGLTLSTCLGNAITLGGSPTASNGKMPYSYAWSPAFGLSSASVSNPTASPTVSTTYSVSVTDANNCSVSKSVLVNILSANFSIQLSNIDSIIQANGDTLSYIVSSQGVRYTESPAVSQNFCLVPAQNNSNLVPVVVTFYTKNSGDTLVLWSNLDSLSNIISLSTVSKNMSTGNIDTIALDSSNYRIALTGGGNIHTIILNPTFIHIVFPSNQLYAILKRDLDASYFLITNGGLVFKYDEDYADKDQVLTYTIYDAYHNTLVSSKNNTAKLFPVKQGDNRYSMNLTACNFTPNGPLGGGMFLLEVENEKKEKMYLRFQNTNLVLPNCPQISGGNGSSH